MGQTKPILSQAGASQQGERQAEGGGGIGRPDDFVANRIDGGRLSNIIEPMETHILALTVYS
jgi:hypothetical protein